MLVYASLPLLFTMLIIGCLYGYEARLLQQNIHLESRLTDQAKLLQQAQDQYIESYHKQSALQQQLRLLQQLKARQYQILYLLAYMGSLMPEGSKISTWHYQNNSMIWTGEASAVPMIAIFAKTLSAIGFLHHIQIQQIDYLKPSSTQTFTIQAANVD
jgi:hypothetical protein